MRQFTIVSLAIAATVFASPLNAAPPTVGMQQVQKVLTDEFDGRIDERRDVLLKLIRTNARCEQARWQAGQLRSGDGWRDFKNVHGEFSESKTLREYRVLREQTAMTYASQRKLADWCRRNKLPARERAHLTVAMQLSQNPNDSQLRGRLGFQRIGGTWMHRRDMLATRERQLEQRKNLKLWTPKIRALSKRFVSRLLRVRSKAETEFKTIKDPAAIPALEAILGSGGMASSKMLVEVLAGMRSHRAADALARTAVLSRWAAIGKEASVRLRQRPIETFAPELLAALRTPIDSKISLFVGQGGVHLMHFAVSETQQTRQIFTGGSSTLIVPVQSGAISSPGGQQRARNRINRATANATIETQLKARAAEKNVAARNEAIQNWNARVCAVLADATGVKLSDDPAEWWDWWLDYNQIEEEEGHEKRREYCRYYERKTEIVDNAEPEVASEASGGGGVVVERAAQAECLVAGTPIWCWRRTPKPVNSIINRCCVQPFAKKSRY